MTLERNGDVLSDTRRRGGGRAENRKQRLRGSEKGMMWWGGAAGCMRRAIAQGSGGRGRERAGIAALMYTRRSSAEGIELLPLLHTSQDAQTTACVCEGRTSVGEFGMGLLEAIKRVEKMNGGMLTEKQGERGRGSITTGAAQIMCMSSMTTPDEDTPISSARTSTLSAAPAD